MGIKIDCGGHEENYWLRFKFLAMPTLPVFISSLTNSIDAFKKIRQN